MNNKEDILDNSKINVLIIEMAKGLEFDNIIVLDEGMSKKEKYIAYTRASKELKILHS